MSTQHVRELTIFYSDAHMQSMKDLRKTIVKDWPILTTTLDFANNEDPNAGEPHKQDSEHAKSCSDCQQTIVEWLLA